MFLKSTRVQKQASFDWAQIIDFLNTDDDLFVASIVVKCGVSSVKS